VVLLSFGWGLLFSFGWVMLFSFCWLVLASAVVEPFWVVLGWDASLAWLLGFREVGPSEAEGTKR